MDMNENYEFTVHSTIVMVRTSQ